MKNIDKRLVKLISSDDVTFELTAEAAKVAGFVNDTLGIDEDTDSDFEPLEIPRVKSEPLKYVVDFLTHYAEDKMPEIPTPLGGDKFEEVRRAGDASGSLCGRGGHLRIDSVLFLA